MNIRVGCPFVVFRWSSNANVWHVPTPVSGPNATHKTPVYGMPLTFAFGVWRAFLYWGFGWWNFGTGVLSWDQYYLSDKNFACCRRFCCRLKNGGVFIYDISIYQVVCKLKGHDEEIHSIRWKPATVSEDIPGTILRPSLVVHIGNRLKIDHCFMMSCLPNVLPTQF